MGHMLKMIHHECLVYSAQSAAKTQTHTVQNFMQLKVAMKTRRHAVVAEGLKTKLTLKSISRCRASGREVELCID